MKKKVLYGATLLAAIMMMFTSCLGEGSNQISPSGVPGVMQFSMSGGNVLVVGLDYPIYDPIFNDPLKFDSNGCYLVAFTLDYDLDANTAANLKAKGYYTVTLNGYDVVDKANIHPYITDTTQIYSNEQPLTNAIVTNNSQAIFSYLSGYLFFPSYFTGLSKQETAWELSYNSSVEKTDVGGKHVYDLYLRATITKEGATPSTDFALWNAFSLKSHVDRINSLEQSNTEYYFRINYIKEIKDGVATWAKSDLLYFPVTKVE